MDHIQGARRFTRLFLVIWLINILITCSAVAQTPAVETDETTERTRTLESQQRRLDKRTSLWGGTGLVFTRTAIVLPRKYLSVGGYFNYSHFQYLQGQANGEVRDPRQNDYELNIVADYGLTHYIELNSFINVFLDDEDSDPEQLHMRGIGMGSSGLGAKFRLMDFYKNNMGITTSFYLRFPSPQKDADITSDELGYGGELNVSLNLALISGWLEKFVIHGNFGYGHFDWFDTALAGLYQIVRESGNVENVAALQGKYRDEYYYSDLFDPTWEKDDFEMEDLWLSEDHYTGSLSFEYNPWSGLRFGVEFVGYSMTGSTWKESDENLQVAPFITYTLADLPFSRQIHPNVITVSLAGNYGMQTKNRSAPQYGIVAGITYHTDFKF